MFQPLILVGLLVLLAGSGCRTGPNVFIAEGAPSGESLHRLVVLPMNFDYRLPANLEKGVELLTKELVTTLRETGHEVEVVSFSEAMQDWASIAKSIGPKVDAGGQKVSTHRYETARVDIARRTLVAHPADAVVIATLMVRQAQYMGRTMQWDGTRQAIKILRDNMNTRTMTDLVQSLSGTGQATSIRVTIYDASATKIFETHAGLEPLLYISESENRFYILEREDLFMDRDILEDGIRRSLAPLFVPR